MRSPSLLVGRSAVRWAFWFEPNRQAIKLALKAPEETGEFQEEKEAEETEIDGDEEEELIDTADNGVWALYENPLKDFADLRFVFKSQTIYAHRFAFAGHGVEFPSKNGPPLISFCASCSLNIIMPTSQLAANLFGSLTGAWLDWTLTREVTGDLSFHLALRLSV